MGQNRIPTSTLQLILAMALFTLVGCGAEKPNVDAALTDLEAELQASDEEYRKAVQAEFSPHDPERVVEQIAQLQRLYGTNIELIGRLQQLLHDPFPKSQKTRFDQIMNQVDDRNKALKEKVESAREVVNQIQAKKTHSPDERLVP